MPLKSNVRFAFRIGRRVRQGSGLIETIVGLAILIPILLFLVDCAALVVAQTSNDALAKEAARAAAECSSYLDLPGPPPQIGGKTAAENIIKSYNLKSNSLTSSASCTVVGLPDNNTWQDVQVNTKIVVRMPVPIPFSSVNTVTFQAQSVEPVVSQFASNSGS